MPRPLLTPIDHAVLTRARGARPTKKVHVSAHDRDCPSSRLLPRYEQLSRWDRLEALLTHILSQSEKCGTTREDSLRLASLSTLADDSIATILDSPKKRRAS